MAMHENPVKLPPGVIEDQPPDEESFYGRELGTTARVTWPWLKSKFGKQPPRDEVSDRDYYNGKWGKLTIEVRPFDANGKWLERLNQEFTADGLRDAQRYGFELMRDLPEVNGFWVEARLDKYWPNKGERHSMRMMTLGRYERAQHTRNARHSDHSTVVQYAVQEMFKGKSPKVAAANTAARLNGGANMFIDSSSNVEIDPEELEEALWRNMAMHATKYPFKPGEERNVARGTLMQFEQWKWGKPFKTKMEDTLMKHMRELQDQVGHTPNSSHYVWLIGHNGVPLESEGPYGPMPLARAESFARIGAKEGSHDRAVSTGVDIMASGFQIVRRYRRGTGERVL